MFIHFHGRCFVNCLIQRSLSIVTSNSIVPSSFILICIVGSDPSNYLLTLRHTMPATIDIIEKSPFFYLVRDDDVVSDHFEDYKNFILIFAYSSSVKPKTHVTDVVVLDALRQSRIRHVILVSQRERMQVSFTYKRTL
ncbi:unnamed protein product [Rotaria sordida]|uniref:Uncharacterized protein n=1 Tax=Rotaria sordida TaxID=392033 RepID=A0A815IS36_9BILA|nr:unnamed protein product [Rotaria sordida]CAF1610943.1 unnamed protein product [Rotaria sordida]